MKTAASDLYRLVYYSRNSMAVAATDVVSETDAILASSRRNNSIADITGALIFNAGIFAQVLEGPRQNVEATFERIQRDKRHGDVQLLVVEKVETRGFPSWSMAFVGRSLEGQNVFGQIAQATGFDARRLEGERVFGIMREIMIEEETKAA